MHQIVCAASPANAEKAALFAQVLAANNIHCIMQRPQSAVPDLGSNGLRQIMVDQQDLDKAKRLLAEMEISTPALDEYDIKGPKRLHIIHWIAGRIQHLAGT